MTEREKLDAYVQWNQMTRHQIITAHLTLIDGTDDAQRSLAEAFGVKDYFGWSDLIDQVKRKSK